MKPFLHFRAVLVVTPCQVEAVEQRSSLGNVETALLKNASALGLIEFDLRGI